MVVSIEAIANKSSYPPIVEVEAMALSANEWVILGDRRSSVHSIGEWVVGCNVGGNILSS